MLYNMADSDYKRVLNLGLLLTLEENNFEYLYNALNTITTYMQIGLLNSGFDHCTFGWDKVSYLLSVNRFKDIEKMFPKEIGLSKEGHVTCKAITNLVMYLYYREEDWKEKAISGGEAILKRKTSSIEEKAVVSCLLSLVEKDFESFASELVNVCKGRKRSMDYLESKFQKKFSFFTLGLYNFARFLYGEEVESVPFPKGEDFIAEFYDYQKSINFEVGKAFIVYEEPLNILNKLMDVKIPTMTLIKKSGKSLIDFEKKNEILRNNLLNM